MSKANESIYDGLKYLYAEQLQGKRVDLTIKKMVGSIDFVSPAGKQKGFDVHFEETDKVFGIAGSTVRRQLFCATGTENPAEMAGKKITLYPIQSKRSATGQAIRIAVPEQLA